MVKITLKPLEDLSLQENMLNPKSVNLNEMDVKRLGKENMGRLLSPGIGKLGVKTIKIRSLYIALRNEGS